MVLLKVKQFFGVWADSLKSMKRPKLFVPFIAFAVIQFIALMILLNFYRFPFDNLLVPVITRFFGENFLHYPNTFMIMPFLFNNANIILGGIFGIVFIGVGTFLFARNYGEKEIPNTLGFKAVLPKYGILFVLWLIESVFVLSIMIGLPILFRNNIDLSYTETRFLQLASFVLGLFIASIFAYTTAAAVLDNRGIKKALATSLAIFGKHVIFTFFLVAIPNLINFPFNYIAGKTQFVLQKFNPEMIVMLLGVTVIVSIFTNYILVGTLTKFYLLQKEDV